LTLIYDSDIGLGRNNLKFKLFPKEETTMRGFLKVFTFVLLVLSLSIVLKPTPGECASAVEYGIRMEGTGYIASVTSNGQSSFDQYLMVFDMSSNSLADPSGNPGTPGTNQQFFTGKITLTDQVTGKTDSTMVTGAWDLTSYKFTITTKTSSRSLSGTFQSDNSLPLVYQDFSNGNTGNFILKLTPPPTP
jgi:hypothetical protein